MCCCCCCLCSPCCGHQCQLDWFCMLSFLSVCCPLIAVISHDGVFRHALLQPVTKKTFKKQRVAGRSGGRQEEQEQECCVNVKDLESTNGTSINGVDILPGR